MGSLGFDGQLIRRLHFILKPYNGAKTNDLCDTQQNWHQSAQNQDHFILIPAPLWKMKIHCKTTLKAAFKSEWRKMSFHCCVMRNSLCRAFQTQKAPQVSEYGYIVPCVLNICHLGSLLVPLMRLWDADFKLEIMWISLFLLIKEG